MNIHHLVRNNILTFKPYLSARRLTHSGNIWLNANECPTTINNYIFHNNDKINRYPECQPKNLIKNYASYAGVSIDQVLVSRGSDEAIELLMKVFCEPKKDKIIFCPPTYGMYKTNAEIFGINYQPILKKKNWQINVSKIISKLENVKLIYICHPNNPTGNTINLPILKNLLELTHNRAIVIIDEAYIDFCPKKSLSTWISKYSHLVILRTLSKAFALAGLRCGFTLANSEIINLLKKIIAPYPLPSPVIDIAEQALTIKNIQNMQKKIVLINKNRDFLIKKLNKFPCVQKIFSSNTNYILVKFNPKYKVFKKLLDQGIILRNQNHQPGLINCLRITIGTFEECQNLIIALKKLSSL